MIYTHWIIENVRNNERFEIIKSGKRAPHYEYPYKIIGCCGYHEKPIERINVEEEQTNE